MDEIDELKNKIEELNRANHSLKKRLDAQEQVIGYILELIEKEDSLRHYIEKTKFITTDIYQTFGPRLKSLKN